MNDRQKDVERFVRLSNTSYQPNSRQPESPKHKDKATKRSLKRRISRVVVLLIVFVLVGISAILFWNVRNFSNASEQLFGSSNVLGLYPTSSLETDEIGRTNILFIGNAGDRPEHGGADLTDTILIVSYSQSGDGYMLSVPRDLYVEIPGHGFGRINEAYPIGERNNFSEVGYATGGVGLLQKTIEETIGVTTHYHATVTFTAVEEVVDALGGITVDIDSPDDRGLYDPNFQEHEGGPLRLQNGRQNIDGQTALRLTRARGSAGGYGFPESDFNRTSNQQQVLSAIIAELDWRIILNPRTNTRLFQATADNTVTDIPMNEVIPLFRLLTRVPTDELRSYTLRDIEGANLLSSFTTPGGAATLVPAAGVSDYSVIQQAINDIHN